MHHSLFYQLLRVFNFNVPFLIPFQNLLGLMNLNPQIFLSLHVLKESHPSMIHLHTFSYLTFFSYDVLIFYHVIFNALNFSYECFSLIILSQSTIILQLLFKFYHIMLIPTIEHVNVRVNLQFRLNVLNSNDS